MEFDTELALWSARAALMADGRNIEARTVEDIQSAVSDGVNLSDTLQELGTFDQKAGDFGLEIIGPILIPILIEAGKQLWGAYVKRLIEQGGAQLADLTIDTVKKLAVKSWTDDPALGVTYAALVKTEAERRGISSEDAAKISQQVTMPQKVQAELFDK